MGVLLMLNLNTNLSTHFINFTRPSQLSLATPSLLKTHHLNSSLQRPPTSLTFFTNKKFKKQIEYAVTSSAVSPSSKNNSRALDALIFDCDGVILESEHLHRNAYNETFTHFNVCCPSSLNPVDWNADFYDRLQNQIGGGKPKMRWYFNKNGWPSSTIFQTPPSNDSDKAKLIDTLQDWKTQKYKEFMQSGTVMPRPGVLQLMDEARATGIKLAVCSAATKSSVILCLENLLGLERFQQLDCFLAGDDVQKKKPDPSIYIEAAKRLGVSAKSCLVVEDSVIGLQAARGAGMECVISYTSSTKDQDFSSALAIYPDLGNVHLEDLRTLLQDTIVALSE